MNWPEVTIESVCETSSGGTPSRENQGYYGGSIPWVKSGELRENIITDTEETITAEAVSNSSAKILPPGTLLIAMYGATVGRMATLGVQAATNQAVCAFTPRNGNIDERFLFHSLQRKIPELLNRRIGGAQPNISQGIIRSLKIRLPPLGEQKRIAAILDKADAIRRKREQTIKLADEFLRSLFLDMFGDPVRNPKGWPIQTFGKQFKGIRYGTGSPPPYVNHGVPFIRATDVKGGRIVKNSLRFISDASAQTIQKCRVDTGDLIIVRSGVNTGDCAVVPKELSGAYAAFDLIVSLDFESAIFYSYLLNSPVGKAILAPLTRRAAQAHLNADQVRGLELIAPPLNLRSSFSRLVEATTLMREVTFAKSAGAVKEVTASLQYRAFRGEL